MPNDREVMRPYRTILHGISSIVWAKSAGRARYVTALSAFDAGYIKNPNPSLVESCRREFRLDGVFGFVIDHCYDPERWAEIKKACQ